MLAVIINNYFEIGDKTGHFVTRWALGGCRITMHKPLTKNET